MNKQTNEWIQSRVFWLYQVQLLWGTPMNICGFQDFGLQYSSVLAMLAGIAQNRIKQHMENYNFLITALDQFSNSIFVISQHSKLFQIIDLCEIYTLRWKRYIQSMSLFDRLNTKVIYNGSKVLAASCTILRIWSVHGIYASSGYVILLLATMNTRSIYFLLFS